MANVRLIVHRRNIAEMSLPGGQIFRWTRRRREEVVRLSRVFAPERTGKLKRSINGTYIPRPGVFQVRMEVRASARHALWVHEGTRAEITPLHSDYMVIPPYIGHGWVKARVVSGQGAQPFLRDALEIVMGRL